MENLRIMSIPASRPPGIVSQCRKGAVIPAKGGIRFLIIFIFFNPGARFRGMTNYDPVSSPKGGEVRGRGT